MFPWYQTAFLLASLVILSTIEFLSFVALNHGLPVLAALSGGQQFLAGLFQGVSVRASGLAIVSLPSLAPALQFLYLIFSQSVCDCVPLI